MKPEKEILKLYGMTYSGTPIDHYILDYGKDADLQKALGIIQKRPIQFDGEIVGYVFYGQKVQIRFIKEKPKSEISEIMVEFREAETLEEMAGYKIKKFPFFIVRYTARENNLTALQYAIDLATRHNNRD